MLVTIAMPVHNGSRFLREAIASLLAQTHEDIEIVISDNASTDETPALCNEFLSRDDRVRYLRQMENRGAFVNAECAVRAGRGKYVMIAGDDDVYDAHYIKKLLPLLEQDPSVGIVYSNYGWIDETGRRTPSRFRRFLDRSTRPSAVFAAYVRHRPCLPMMMGLTRAELLCRALPFDSLGELTGDQDNLLMLRLLSTGCRVDSSPEVLFHYRLKDRASAAVPSDFPKTGLCRYIRLLRHNIEVTRRICTIIDTSAYRTKERLFLKYRALETLIAYFSLLPLLTHYRNRFKSS